MGEAQPAGGQAPVTAAVTGRRLRLVSPLAAVVLGGLLLVLIAVDVPLARLAHQSVSAGGGSSPVWFSAAFGVLGFVVAWRRPGQPARLDLPADCVLLRAEPGRQLLYGGRRPAAPRRSPAGLGGGAHPAGLGPTIALLGLAVLLFPDGALPSPRWRPLRHRVQRVVDLRFNRARCDAEQTVTAFAARLQDAVDLDSMRDDLAGVVRTALEPAQVSVWISQHG